ncbi:MAG TPA: hypothetical protein VF796_27655, partial [Humisphaera sp.]
MTAGRRRTVRLLLATLAAAGLCAAAASCTVGPDFARPELALPAGYKSPTTAPLTTQPVRPDWWTLFNDPVLNDLQEQAAQASPTLAAAAARV